MSWLPRAGGGVRYVRRDFPDGLRAGAHSRFWALGRANRTTIPQPSGAKAEIIDYIRMRSKLRLTQSTTLGTRKFNIFVWEGRNA